MVLLSVYNCKYPQSLIYLNFYFKIGTEQKRNSNYRLPGWKKIELNTGRNILPTDLDFEAARTIVSLEPRIRETLLKIQVNESFDVNTKALSLLEVKILQDTLEALGGQGAKDGPVKDGLVYSILREFYRILSFNLCNVTR